MKKFLPGRGSTEGAPRGVSRADAKERLSRRVCAKHASQALSMISTRVVNELSPRASALEVVRTAVLRARPSRSSPRLGEAHRASPREFDRMKRVVLAGLTAAILLLAGLALVHGRAHAGEIPTMYRDHMEMTLHAPERPGDRARADAIVAAAKQVMAEYPTVEAAEKAGFHKFSHASRCPSSTIRTVRTPSRRGSDASTPRIRRR